MACPRPRSNIDTERALSVLPTMLEQLQLVSDMEGKSGVMFCLMNESTGELVIEPTMIGEITNGKEERYAALCQEKATRLREYRKSGHWLSWQSRDPANDKWGGAISDGEYIWSPSGLKEDQDESLALMSAHSSGRIMNGAPQEYAGISNNLIILDNEYLFWIPKWKPEDGEE